MVRLIGSLVCVASLAAFSAAHANGAKPTNPQGFGKLVSGTPNVGQMASTDARNANGPGVSFEVHKGRDEQGSKPNLPPSTP